MADVGLLVKRLALQDGQAVAAKAAEYARLATARLGPGGLGPQLELCKGAACVELACMTLGVPVDSSLVGRWSGVNDKVYRNARAALQKVLGVTSKVTARELCIKFGCARHDQSVRAALAAYKERFVRSLPAAQQARVDFGRPVFLAVAFYLVARKHKVQVDRSKLLDPLGVTATEFAQVSASMADLCGDLVGEPRKRKAEDVGRERGALVERTGGVAGDEEASDSGDEVEDEGQVGFRLNAKKQRQREYEAWKGKMLAKESQAGGSSSDAPGPSHGSGSGSGSGGGGGGGSKKEHMTEKKLRQATLSFGAAAQKAQAAAKPSRSAATESADKGGEAKAGAAAAKIAKQGNSSGNTGVKPVLASKNS